MVIIGLCLDGPRSNVFRIGRRPRVLPIFAASRAPRCQSPFGTIRDRPVTECTKLSVAAGKKNQNLCVSGLRTPTMRICTFF